MGCGFGRALLDDLVETIGHTGPPLTGPRRRSIGDAATLGSGDVLLTCPPAAPCTCVRAILIGVFFFVVDVARPLHQPSTGARDNIQPSRFALLILMVWRLITLAIMVPSGGGRSP